MLGGVFPQINPERSSCTYADAADQGALVYRFFVNFSSSKMKHYLFRTNQGIFVLSGEEHCNSDWNPISH